MLRNGWTLGVAALLLLSGCQKVAFEGPTPLAPTGYEEEHDVYIVFKGQHFSDVASFLPLELVGQLAFELQEGTHASVRHVGVAEVDYYYIWLCLEDACIPVDPFRVGMSR